MPLAQPARPRAVASQNIRFVGHSDQGGRSDGVQVMVHRGHAYIGHTFSNGITIVDVRDPGASADGRVHRLPAQHAGRAPPDPRRPPPGGQRPERLAHAGVPEPAGLLRGLAGRQAPGPRGQLRIRHPRLRRLPPRQAGRDRVHAGRRNRPSPHLVHGGALRLRLHPLRRRHRPRPGRHRHVRPPSAGGRRPLVDPRHVAGRRGDADVAQGPALRAPPRPRGRRRRLRRLARRGSDRSRRRRPHPAEAPGASELGSALRRRDALAPAVAGPEPPRRRRRADHDELQPGPPLRVDVRRARARRTP